MKPNEFDRWRDDFGRSFPSFVRWFNDLPDDVQSRQITLWRRVLADVDYRDALAVNYRMYSGDDPPPGRYDSERERIASHVRTLAKALSARREPPTNESADPIDWSIRRRRLTDNKQATLAHDGGTLVTYEALRANGLTEDEALDEMFGPAPEDHRRYNCCDCLDSGVVTVWAPSSVAAYRAGLLATDPTYRRSCAAPCSCSAGDRWMTGDGSRQRGKWSSEETRYTPDRYAICRDGDKSSDEAIAKLAEWIESKGLPAQSELF